MLALSCPHRLRLAPRAFLLALHPALGLPRLSGRSCQLLCRGGYSLRACVLPWLASRLCNAKIAGCSRCSSLLALRWRMIWFPAAALGVHRRAREASLDAYMLGDVTESDGFRQWRGIVRAGQGRRFYRGVSRRIVIGDCVDSVDCGRAMCISARCGPGRVKGEGGDGSWCGVKFLCIAPAPSPGGCALFFPGGAVPHAVEGCV